MIIKRIEKKNNMTEARAFKIAENEALIDPSLDAIFIEQKTINDLLMHEFGRIRRCTPAEWTKFFYENL